MLYTPVYFSCGHKGQVTAPEEMEEIDHTIIVSAVNGMLCPFCGHQRHIVSGEVCPHPITSAEVFIPLTHCGIELIECGITALTNTNDPVYKHSALWLSHQLETVRKVIQIKHLTDNHNAGELFPIPLDTSG